MGYTHYWKIEKELNETKFKKFAGVCRKLKNNLPSDIKICNGLGTEQPLIDNDIVNFNGDGSQNLDHETFQIQLNDMGYDFCKTARKPYDLLVGSCLLAAHFILGITISSDGDITDWKPIADFFNDIMSGEYIVTDELLLKLFGDYTKK